MQSVAGSCGQCGKPTLYKGAEFCSPKCYSENVTAHCVLCLKPIELTQEDQICGTCRVVALDTETFLIQPGLLAPPLVCVTLAVLDENLLVKHDDADLLGLCQRLLKGKLVGANIAYDMGVLAAKWPELLPLIFEAYENNRITDVQIREKLLHIAMGIYRGYPNAQGDFIPFEYSLEAIAKRRLGVQLIKSGWRLRFSELADVPVDEWPVEATEYALTDAAATLRIWEHQEARRAENQKDYLLDEFRQAKAAWWLHLMACWGLHTDPEGVKQFAKQVQKKHDEIFETLVAAGFMREDGTRNTKAAKMQMLAVRIKEGKPAARTATGRVKLDADACESSGDPLLVQYAEISSLKKKLSTDVPLLEQGIVTPIQPRFDLLETGRTSSSPNVQNLPTAVGVRECFVPRFGELVYAAADYSGFELRTFAQVCISNEWESELAKTLNAGKDPHLELARRILKIPYEEAFERNEAGEELLYNTRQTSKVGNFGFMGGLGAKRFVVYAWKQYGVAITLKEAEKLKEHWKETWPETKPFFRWVGSQCDVPVPQIQQLFSGRYRGRVSYTEACNSFFQGLAADAAKAAGFLIAKACYVDEASPLFGCRLVNFVHDEFIVEAPEETAAEAAEELSRLMKEGAAPFLPDVPPVAAPLLMRRWSKKAKALRDENGRLVPWG